MHVGHIYTLTEAKKYGDVLIVAIARDEMILKKGRTPIHPQEYRQLLVNALKPVDFAILGGNDPKEVVGKVKPDVIVYGYDQKPFLKPKGVKIVKLKEHIDDHKFKSSIILKRLGL